MIEGKTTVYVCEDTICKLPTANLEQIKESGLGRKNVFLVALVVVITATTGLL